MKKKTRESNLRRSQQPKKKKRKRRWVRDGLNIMYKYLIHTKLASKKSIFFDEAKNVFELEKKRGALA